MKISIMFLLILKKKLDHPSNFFISINFSSYYRATFGLKKFLNIPFLKYFY